MSFRYIILLFCGTSYASYTRDTISLNSELIINMEFSENAAVLPSLSCSSVGKKIDNGWHTQTVYYRDEILQEKFGFMVEATVEQEGNVRCRYVQSSENRQIRERTNFCLEKCKFESTNETIEEEGTTEEGKDVTISNRDKDKEDDGGSGNCKEGYTYIKELHSCYFLSNYTAQWFDAECACASHEGTLVIIDSEKEHTILKAKLNESTWIGLNDQSVEGRNVWRDGSVLNFTKWAAESVNTDEKDCVEMSADFNFDWLSQPCDVQRKFLCEAVNSSRKSLGVCPEGWKINHDANICLHVSKTSQNWNESTKVCSDVGGTLASIHTVEESLFIRGLHLNESIWIGLTDKGKRGNFTWIDGSSNAYTNWIGGSPNIFQYINGLFVFDKNCCELKFDNSFMWNVNSCANKLKALCTRPVEILPSTHCPSGWESDDAGSCYLISKLKADYNTSKELCSFSAVGAKLVVPNTTIQETFISNLLKKHSMNDVWLGVRVGEALTLGAKASLNLRGLFNLLTGRFNSHDCVRMQNDGKWYGKPCIDKHNYVCETSRVRSTEKKMLLLS